RDLIVTGVQTCALPISVVRVEVNPSADFAPGSKVCCSGYTIATSLSPTKVFKDDTYHWRVRALDPDDNAGVWNVGQTFQKTFDRSEERRVGKECRCRWR